MYSEDTTTEDSMWWYLHFSHIPYSRKLLRMKTFTNWWKFSQKKLMRIVHSYHKRVHAQISRRKPVKSQNLEIRESFLSRKFPVVGYIDSIWYLFGFSCAIKTLFGMLQTLGCLFEPLLLKFLPKCVTESIRYTCVVLVAIIHALYISKIIA